MTYPATIFCVVPVHNRAGTTRRFLDQLRRQNYGAMRVLVVDDGSTDGTRAMLESYAGLRLEVVAGSGDLWWGGAMRLGMQVAAGQMGAQDALLMLNDDVELADDFLTRIAERAREVGPLTVVGARQQDIDTGQEPFFGYRVDYLRCRVEMLRNPVSRTELLDVDALCGRGTLFSRDVVARAGYIDAGKFPHFWGDIEYSARAKDLGFRLVCDPNIAVGTSFVASDEKRVGSNWWRRLVSPVSSRNIVQHYLFWACRGPKLLAKTAIFRFPFIKLGSALIGAARGR
jgi:GT2 family glycosyltransferase